MANQPYSLVFGPLTNHFLRKNLILSVKHLLISFYKVGSYPFLPTFDISNKFNYNLFIMRKIKLLAVALVIGTASLFAATVEEVPSEEIRSQIVKLLQTPDFGIDTEMTVNISFTFSSEGEVVVLSVDSKRRNVLNYIRHNLNYKKIQNPGEKDKLYTMPLKIAKA